MSFYDNLYRHSVALAQEKKQIKWLSELAVSMNISVHTAWVNRMDGGTLLGRRFHFGV